MLSVLNRPSQQLLGTDFSTELTSQKQLTDELCEVLSFVVSDLLSDVLLFHLDVG